MMQRTKDDHQVIFFSCLYFIRWIEVENSSENQHRNQAIGNHRQIHSHSMHESRKCHRPWKLFVSIFIDPDLEQIEAAKGVGAQQIEICTAEFAELTLSARAAHGEGAKRAKAEVERIKRFAEHAKKLGLIIAAGHGLTYRNVGALAAIPEITEFNIGHNVISRSIFVGLNQAVREMIKAIQ